MSNITVPTVSAHNYTAAVPAAQPVVRKVVRKAITRPAVASPYSGQGQQFTYAPDMSSSSAVELGAHQQYGGQTYAPELQRTNTGTSVASSSGRSSLFSNNPPLSPLTDITTPSPSASPFQPEKTTSLNHALHQDVAPPSYFALCAHCNGAIPQTCATIQCLICSSSNQPNVITSICSQCYAAAAPRSGHNHDISFFACDSDAILRETKIPQELWTVRRNSSKRLWYEHRASGYKTWVTPMTAVCGLPPGWQQRRDPEGNTYFENTATGEMSRTPPGSLPPGWTEAKDPDGKPFFVHNELQLASWCRPGQQPQNSAPNTAQLNTGNQAAVQVTARPPVSGIPPPNKVRPTSMVMTSRPPVQAQRPPAMSRPSQQPVTLGTATEATINLIDPTNGGIIRNTKIVGHIAGQGVKGTVNAVAQNQRLQAFARGTGLAAANKRVKKAWRKAAKEVASLDTYRRQEIKISQTGPQGQIVVEGADTGFDGEYVIEYEDGTIEYYDASGKIQGPSTILPQRPPPQQNPTLVQRPAIQQRPTQQAQQTQGQQLQGQQLQAQQLQTQQQLQSQQQPTQPQYVYTNSQSQPNLLEHALAGFQQSLTSTQPQSLNQTQTIYLDQAPAQTIYVDQAQTQSMYMDQTTYVDQNQVYTVDNTDVNVTVDVNVDVNIDQNVYVEQSGYEQEQVYELQDDGCVDGGFEGEGGECEF